MRFPVPDRANDSSGAGLVALGGIVMVRIAIAVIAGLALTVAFPKPGWAGLAWIAPGMLLGGALGSSPKRGFLLGYAGGIAHYLTSLHWLLYNPFPAGAAAGWLALSAYLAFYPAIWTWACFRLLPKPTAPGRTTFQPASTGSAVYRSVAQLVESGWAGRLEWAIACATLWVALEMIRARFLTGFPWNLLGVSQLPLTPLIQISAVTGVYGVSFVVAWGSVSLLCAAAKLVAQVAGPVDLGPVRRRPFNAAGIIGRKSSDLFFRTFRLALLAEIGLPLLAVLLMTFVGGARLARSQPATREIKLALVQPSIPQRLVFDPREATNRFNTIMKLSELALAARPDVLVWPEASLPSFEASHFQTLTNMIASHHAWMIFGADDVVPRRAAERESEYDFYNSGFLFDRHGRYVSTYRKRHLVVFGEYVPLERWLPFMRYLTPVETSFTPGPGPVRFNLDDLGVVTSVLICFEDVLPHLVREHVEPDTDFLLNLTNDAWFGESAAQWQHAFNAAFRALENGLPMVRCTNNGLSCWIDAFGRLRDVGFSARDDVYGSGFKLVHVPLLPGGKPRVPTFYTRHGDLFGWGCVLLGGAMMTTVLPRSIFGLRVLRPE